MKYVFKISLYREEIASTVMKTFRKACDPWGVIDTIIIIIIIYIIIQIIIIHIIHIIIITITIIIILIIRPAQLAARPRN